MKLLTVGVRFGGTVQLRNNLKPFGSPTLALSLSASASYYLDTFSRWGSWRQHGMHGQLALQVGPLWLIAQVLVLELEPETLNAGKLIYSIRLDRK